MNLQKKMMTVRTSLKSGKDAVNSFGKYNYRNAESMLAGINPLLQKQGLTLDFSDEVMFIPPSRYYIKTTCTVHDTEDGESYSVSAFAREQEQKKGMDEAQITGSTMTYAHKYALMSMFAISDPRMDPDSMDNSNDKQETEQKPKPVYGQTTPPPMPQQGYGQQQQQQGYYGGYRR